MGLELESDAVDCTCCEESDYDVWFMPPFPIDEVVEHGVSRVRYLITYWCDDCGTPGYTFGYGCDEYDYERLH